MKPLIGIPCHDSADAAGRRQYVLGRKYVDCIRQAGGAAVIIPPAMDAELARPVFRSLDGLLLAGGGDVEPWRYQRPQVAAITYVHVERDETELPLTRWAVADDLPVLAICRGIQVLNVALGGTLIQDIPSQVPGALIHQPGPKAPRPRPQHPVQVDPTSQLAQILGQGHPIESVQVNSFHHQAAEEIGAGLRVVATAPDGIVEGLELPGQTFVVGVQWHPEEMAEGDPVQMALFTAFVAACARRG